MTETVADHLTVERILFRTMDPTVKIDGQPVPALTTLLHRVCGDDETKFAEATRLIELFLAKALAIPREG